jgi:hypothetical protein
VHELLTNKWHKAINLPEGRVVANELAYSEVGRVLDQLRGASAVPNGLRKAIAAAIDALRDARAPEDHVAAAGQVSVAIHQWEWALCLGNADKQQAARNRLDEIDTRWWALAVLEAA